MLARTNSQPNRTGSKTGVHDTTRYRCRCPPQWHAWPDARHTATAAVAVPTRAKQPHERHPIKYYRSRKRISVTCQKSASSNSTLCQRSRRTCCARQAGSAERSSASARPWKHRSTATTLTAVVEARLEPADTQEASRQKGNDTWTLGQERAILREDTMGASNSRKCEAKHSAAA